MISASITLFLLLRPAISDALTQHTTSSSFVKRTEAQTSYWSASDRRRSILNTRNLQFDEEEFIHGGRKSIRKEGEGGHLEDDVEFFDLDGMNDLEDDVGKTNDDEFYGIYDGIIPNPLLDAMDPDGVYERLGPELFRDSTFWRDMVLFAVFFALFTKDTHHYGTFDSVVEGLERLPANFVPLN